MIINNEPIDISLQFHSPRAPRALRPLAFIWGQFVVNYGERRSTAACLFLRNGTRRTLREHRLFVFPGDVRHGLQREEQTHREPGGPEGDQARA